MTLGTNPEDGWFWKQQFGQWLTNQKGEIMDIHKHVTNVNYQKAWSDMVKKWQELDKTKKSLDEKYQAIFEIPNAAAAYADFFGLSWIGSWFDLANNGDISKGQSGWESGWWWNWWEQQGWTSATNTGQTGTWWEQQGWASGTNTGQAETWWEQQGWTSATNAGQAGTWWEQNQ